MHYIKEFLSQPGLFKRGMFTPLFHDEARGLFIGMYEKDRFDSLETFSKFVGQISTITQWWYKTNDIDGAYENYVEDDRPESESWIVRAPLVEGSLREWIEELGPNLDTNAIPEKLTGKFHWCGDVEEFDVVGETESFYFEGFIADDFRPDLL